MIENTRFPVTLGLLILLIVAPAVHSQSTQLSSRFALEIQMGQESKPTYAIVARTPDEPQPMGFSVFYALLPVPENSSATPAEKPFALGLQYHEDGDAVSLVASLYFGPRTDKIEDLSKHPHKDIGNYSLRLEESVTLEEMKSFGVQAVGIKVVGARGPRTEIQALSNVPGLQMAVAGEDRVFYKLEIRNLTPKSVIGLVIETSSAGGKSSVGSYDDRGPLIAPGGFHRMPMGKDGLECAPPENPTLDPVPCPIVLEGVLFADGTHIGHSPQLASMEAQGAATDGPRRQLRQLMQTIADDPALSDEEKLARLRSEIPAFPAESIAAVIDQLRPRYPDLSEGDWEHVRNTLNSSVQRGIEITLRSLEKYEESLHGEGKAESLVRWMRRWGMID